MKIIMKIFIICALLSIFSFCNVKAAALQSNTNTPITKNRNTWINDVRKMEGLNGTLGLEETQNSDLTPTAESGSNNLDIHMQKNTEYGAMVLLSASNYGKSGKINSGETTTGNKTGLVIPYNYEWTAAHYPDYYALPAVDGRYIDNYGTASENNRKNGDASAETQNWHGSTYVYQVSRYEVHNGGSTGYWRPGGVVRCGSTGVFAFHNRANYGTVGSFDVISTANDVALPSNSYTSRAVIVNGQGIN